MASVVTAPTTTNIAAKTDDTNIAAKTDDIDIAAKVDDYFSIIKSKIDAKNKQIAVLLAWFRMSRDELRGTGDGGDPSDALTYAAQRVAACMPSNAPTEVHDNPMCLHNHTPCDDNCHLLDGCGKWPTDTGELLKKREDYWNQTKKLKESCCCSTAYSFWKTL
jgi:hypothetical protein